MRRTILLLTMIGAGLILASGVALAAITPTTNASLLANVVTRDTDFITGASFVSLPPKGQPNAVSDTALVGFPTHSGKYGILTTGDAALADDPNSANNSGVDNGGGNVRGNTDYDVTVLKIDLSVPSDANCLALNFKFLSEEYPEYVGSNYNDAFIAEIDNSTWTTSGSTISAPGNFAFDENGQPISINSTGKTSVSSGAAAGTTYDGATKLLQARKPINPGAHSLYLSIFDQGDRIFDSAAFIDNLNLLHVPLEQCKQGAQLVDTKPPVIKKVSPAPGLKIKDRTPTIKATVKDDLTNLSKGNITLTVAGKAIPRNKFSYNRSTDRLTYTSPKLSLGKKVVKITAKDAAKNVGKKSWYFTIVKG